MPPTSTTRPTVSGPVRRAAAATIAAVVALGAVAGCSSDTSADAGSTSTTAAVAGATGSAASGGSSATWSVSLTSEQTQLHTVGADGQLTYGWNQLTGTTTIDGTEADVELLGSVDYVDGSGPWTGFVTITRPDGVVAFDATGTATLDDSSGDTAFVGELAVIGGTGTYVDVTGAGTLTGQRDSSLGGQVDFEVTTTLAGVDGG